MNGEQTINFLLEGNVACFRRPEFSDDLVTCDVMPPVVAARLIDLAFPSIADELLRQQDNGDESDIQQVARN